MEYLSVRRLTIGLLFVAGGCAGDAEQEHALGVTRQAVVNGADDDSSHDSVVRIASSAGDCTGTMIAPNLLVTARHCVSVVGDVEGEVCNADGTATGGTGADIKNDIDPATISVSAGVDANITHVLLTTGRALVVNPSTTTCHQDIGFIVLADRTPLPYVAIRRGTGAIVGELVTLVGYGLTGVPSANPELPEMVPPTRRIRRDVAVRAVGPGIASGLDTLGAAEFATGEGSCSGDSGGPAFASDGTLLGAVSRGGAGAPCLGTDAVSVFTDVTKYRDLIDRAFTAAGYPGGPPPYIPPPASAESGGCRVTPGDSTGMSAASVIVAGIIVGLRRRRQRKTPS